MINFIKELFKKMNETGIYIPMAHDPKTNLPSASLTLLCISSFLVVAGIIGKWSKVIGDIDITNALNFFYACGALYFSRKISPDGKISISEEKSKE
mgnify:CR=1 FL=1